MLQYFPKAGVCVIDGVHSGFRWYTDEHLLFE